MKTRQEHAKNTCKELLSLKLLVFFILFPFVVTYAQWQKISWPFDNNSIFPIASSGANIFVGNTTGKLISSTDNGSSWTDIHNGLPGSSIKTILISGTNIFAGIYGKGMYWSPDNGSNWTAINTGFTSSYVYSLTLNGTDIFAGAFGSVFMSTNNGSSWTILNNGLPANNYWSVGIIGTNILTGTNNSIVYLSPDYGLSWSKISDGLASKGGITSFAVIGTKIIASTSGSGIFLSSDTGSTWTAVNNGLTDLGLSVSDLAISGNNIFACSDFDGVFLSTDSCGSWSDFNQGLTTKVIRSLAVSGTTIFATTSDGIWKRSISGLVGIKEIDRNPGFTIYPNPITSSSILKLNEHVQNAEVCIYDIYGKLRIKNILNGNQMEIKERSLAKGVYFVSVSTADKQYIQKIVIQ